MKKLILAIAIAVCLQSCVNEKSNEVDFSIKVTYFDKSIDTIKCRGHYLNLTGNYGKTLQLVSSNGWTDIAHDVKSVSVIERTEVVANDNKK